MSNRDATGGAWWERSLASRLGLAVVKSCSQQASTDVGELFVSHNAAWYVSVLSDLGMYEAAKERPKAQQSSAQQQQRGRFGSRARSRRERCPTHVREC
jgi:hypothetical protein